MMQRYYDLLGIEESATAEDIVAAYRKKAKIHHPDVKGGNAETFKQVNQAYNVLKDNYKRKIYDTQLKINENLSSVKVVASDRERQINVVVGLALVAMGILCWAIGDKKGEAYNGILVLFGWVFLLYGIGILKNKSLKFTSPLGVAKYVLGNIALAIGRIIIKTSLIGVFLFGLILILASLSWVNQHYLNLFPDSF